MNKVIYICKKFIIGWYKVPSIRIQSFLVKKILVLEHKVLFLGVICWYKVNMY